MLQDWIFHLTWLYSIFIFLLYIYICYIFYPWFYAYVKQSLCTPSSNILKDLGKCWSYRESKECGFANHYARLCPLWRIACLWKLYGNYCVKIQSKCVFFVFVFLGELPHDRSEMYSVGWFIFHFPLQFSFVLASVSQRPIREMKNPSSWLPYFLLVAPAKKGKW